MKRKKWFKLPNMRLSREDHPLLKNKTDKEMQNIANKLGFILCNGWDEMIEDMLI